jgi:hypothetical protein
MPCLESIAEFVDSNLNNNNNNETKILGYSFGRNDGGESTFWSSSPKALSLLIYINLSQIRDSAEKMT